MILDNKRIFYVEDDVKNQIIVQTMLEHAGAVVGFARWGGDNVIAKLCNFQPDIILLDLSMPFGVSGYDVFDFIRESEIFDSVPVIAVSALDPTVEIPKARAKGFAGFISKPLKLLYFAEQIASVTTGVKVWD